MNIEHYSIFLITTLLLVMVPGPSAMVASAQGASLQSKKAFIGVLGIASADIAFFALSATGIATLIIASSTMFMVIKWLGVLFLIYLGLSVLFSKSPAIKFDGQKTDGKAWSLYTRGLIIQFANPKALMYFSALLPQFIDPDKPLTQQILIMGFSLFLADLLVYSSYAFMGSYLAKQKLKSWAVGLINKTAGTALLYTGFKMALLDNRHP
ncbi:MULTISPECIES: LysE family translocator [Thiomicrorhabdus]|uniref:LysE family translocator n=1 Tax=Thiomicrorhabdus heinhorstiae TaxID=2748010 RepID=A0ABS0BS83_9GAMM|nr:MULTISPECIES: LysE family translocator [Thiomicrorhabdus]MBF6056737.1 LysE family translocator [Thiomicrorhabdus heinhorstiae]